MEGSQGVGCECEGRREGEPPPSLAQGRDLLTLPPPLEAFWEQLP